MVPAVRAIADRFIYDTATLKYITAAAGDEIDRPTPHSGWTVRQLLAHLAENQQRYADSLRCWLDDEPGFSLPGDPTEANVAAAQRNTARPLAEIAALFDSSIRGLVEQSARVDEARAAGAMSGWPAMRVLAVWSTHARAHAVDLVSSLPELKCDPMVLNWALHFDFSHDLEAARWQQELAREVRAMFQVQGRQA